MTEQEFRERFGKRLLYAMMDRGYSVNRLARKTNIHKTTIKRYLYGEVTPTATNIIKLKYALKCSVDDLLYFGETIID